MPFSTPTGDTSAEQEDSLPAPEVPERSAPLTPPPPGPPPLAAATRRKVWPWILLTIAGTLVVGFVGLAALGFWMQSQPLIDDDMDNGTGPFVAESDPFVELRYEDGGYVMDLTPMQDGNLQYARSFWGVTRPEVDFAISYELRDAPDDVDHVVAIGCVGAGGSYWFYLSADGTAGIELWSADGGVLEEVDAPRLASSDRLRIVCEDGAADGPTSVVGYLDGEQLVAAQHENGFGSFQAVGIAAFVGGQEPYVVVWDDAYAD